jgi:hypothetical protein
VRVAPREFANSTVSSWSELRQYCNIRVDDEVRVDSAELWNGGVANIEGNPVWVVNENCP